MRLKLEYSGSAFDIYVVVLPTGEIPAINFLTTLEQQDRSSHKAMVQRYHRHAEIGQSHNIRHSRKISGKDNLYEFKTRQGDRLLYFYLPGRRTVLALGFHKGDPEEAHFDRAERYQRRILELEESSG